jgi:hypothetical protein
MEDANLDRIYVYIYTYKIIRVTKLRKIRHAEHMEKVINSCIILVGKPERKRLLGKPRRRWKDNIIMDLK